MRPILFGLLLVAVLVLTAVASYQLGSRNNGRYSFIHIPSEHVVTFSRLDTRTGRIEIIGSSATGRTIIELAPPAGEKLKEKQESQFKPWPVTPKS